MAALKEACKKADVDLKIASVTGDDMMPLRKQLMSGDPVKISEMSTGQALPKTVHSMTAYFGAGPIVHALDMGADIGKLNFQWKTSPLDSTELHSHITF